MKKSVEKPVVKKAAFIFAAGFGKRMQHLGEHTPKCLLKVNDKPLLWYIINRLKQAGITQLVINLHHQGDLIREYVQSENDFDVDISFSTEQQILETGGGLKKAWPLLSDADTIVLHNADIYTPFDLRELINAHEQHPPHTLATLLVKDRPSSRYFLVNDQQQIIGHENQSTQKMYLLAPGVSCHPMAFSGIHVISNRLGQYLTEMNQAHFSIIDVYLNALKQGEYLKAHDMKQCYFQDVGTPERLNELQAYLGDNPVV